ncbi:MAG: hypothetical protein MUC94_08650 [bacterium]|nr:hypothetical protein [bacterium]
MKQSTALVISLIGLIFILGCNGDKIENQWADREIAIDGKFADWEGIAQYTLEDQNLVMGVANDVNNLYLMFRWNDEQMARRIQMMGVTIWLDKENKKQKNYGLNYTGSTDIHVSYRPKMERDDRKPREMEERMAKMGEKHRGDLPGPGRIFIIEGDQKTERSEIALDGPVAGSAYDNGVFCYEFKLPIPMGIKNAKELKLGLELGGMSKEDRAAMRQELGGMPGRGERSDDGERPDGEMGGRPGGRGDRPGAMGARPGGMRGGERPTGAQGFEKQEVWFTVALAEKK